MDPSPDGDENLRNEGIPASRIERVGNIMLDCYELSAAAYRGGRHFPRAGARAPALRRRDPSPAVEVDDPATLGVLVAALVQVAREMPLVFSVHPRTRKKLREFDLHGTLEAATGVRLCEPVG